MRILVYGGSGSGKSAYAEEKACKLHTDSDGELYYLATMQVFDEEDEKRISRHRGLRSGKDFITIEQSHDISAAFPKIEHGSTVLLECMSNLVANEMFADEETYDYNLADEKTFIDISLKIKKDIDELSDICDNLVVVSNNVFDDGTKYEDTTKSYMRLLADINRFLADGSDEVWEVVAGIPIRLK